MINEAGRLVASEMWAPLLATSTMRRTARLADAIVRSGSTTGSRDRRAEHCFDLRPGVVEQHGRFAFRGRARSASGSPTVRPRRPRRRPATEGALPGAWAAARPIAARSAFRGAVGGCATYSCGSDLVHAAPTLSMRLRPSGPRSPAIGNSTIRASGISASPGPRSPAIRNSTIRAFGISAWPGPQVAARVIVSRARVSGAWPRRPRRASRRASARLRARAARPRSCRPAT